MDIKDTAIIDIIDIGIKYRHNGYNRGIRDLIDIIDRYKI